MGNEHREESKSVHNANNETEYTRDRNQITNTCAYQLASSSSLKSLVEEESNDLKCSNIRTLNKASDDCNNDGIEKGGKIRNTYRSLSTIALAQTISDRIIKKMSNDLFTFHPMYVMEKDIISQIDIIADRIDMQCFYISKSEDTLGLSVGQYMKLLANDLLSLKHGNHQQIRNSGKTEINSKLYLQMLLLLSRAPVQSMRKKIMNDSFTLGVSPTYINQSPFHEIKDNFVVFKNRNDTDLITWEKHFTEEIDPNYDDCFGHMDMQMEQETDEFENDVKKHNKRDLNYFSNKRQSSYSIMKETDDNLKSDSNNIPCPIIHMQKEIPKSEQELRRNNQPPQIYIDKLKRKMYGIEAIDQIQNYIFLPNVISHHRAQNNDGMHNIHDSKNKHNMLENEDNYAISIENDRPALYTSEGRMLSFHLYANSLPFQNKENTTPPSAVATVSEVELCRALSSTLRGLPSSYFILVPPHTSKNRYHKHNNKNLNQKSNFSGKDDPHWMVQANVTNVWPITTSLSHKAICSTMEKALINLADPISVVREFCSFSPQLISKSSCGAEKMNFKQHVLLYASSSRIYAAFRNCLQENILQPFEMQVSRYDAELYKTLSCNPLKKHNHNYFTQNINVDNSIESSEGNRNVHNPLYSNKKKDCEMGTLLTFINTLTSRWSKPLNEARRLIHGAFPSWRSWQNYKLESICQHHNRSAIYSTACLNYLYDMVKEEDLLKNHIFSHPSITYALFLATLTSYCRLLEGWILEGKLNDPVGEFFICRKCQSSNHDGTDVNQDVMEPLFCDEQIWINLEPFVNTKYINGVEANSDNIFTIRGWNEVIPRFLADIALDLFWCGVHVYIIRYGVHRISANKTNIGQLHGENNFQEDSAVLIKNKGLNRFFKFNDQHIAKELKSFTLMNRDGNEIHIKHAKDFVDRFSFISSVNMKCPMERELLRPEYHIQISGEVDPKYCNQNKECDHKKSSLLFDDSYMLPSITTNKEMILLRDRLFTPHSIEMPQKSYHEIEGNDATKVVLPEEDHDKSLRRSFPKSQLESLLVSDFRIQCNTVGEVLCEMLWEEGRIQISSCPNFLFREHLTEIHKLFCMTNHDVFRPILAELFSSLDDVFENTMKTEFAINKHILNHCSFTAPLFASSARMTSILRLAIENHYWYEFDIGNRRSDFHQNSLRKMLSSACIQVAKCCNIFDHDQIEFSRSSIVNEEKSTLQTNLNFKKTCRMSILGSLKLILYPTWPMNIIFSQNLLEKYGQIFSRLLQLKYGLYVCETFWSEISQLFVALEIRKVENRNFSKAPILERKWIGLFHKISHVVRCFHEHSISSTAGNDPSTFRNFNNTDNFHTIKFERGFRTIISKQHKYVEHMLKRCFLTSQDEILFSYMNSLLSDGIRILSYLKQMTKKYDEGEIQPCMTFIDKMEKQWDQNMKFLVLTIEQMSVTLEDGKNYEDLLIRLNFNGFF